MQQDKPIVVVVYRITGKQLFFIVPKSVCEECDLSVAVARQVIEGLRPGVAELTVKPWLSHLPEALFRGGWHPPLVTVDGKLFSQGVVPDPDALEHAILAAVQRLSPAPPTSQQARR